MVLGKSFVFKVLGEAVIGLCFLFEKGNPRETAWTQSQRGFLPRDEGDAGRAAKEAAVHPGGDDTATDSDSGSDGIRFATGS